MPTRALPSPKYYPHSAPLFSVRELYVGDGCLLLECCLLTGMPLAAVGTSSHWVQGFQNTCETPVFSVNRTIKHWKEINVSYKWWYYVTKCCLKWATEHEWVVHYTKLLKETFQQISSCFWVESVRSYAFLFLFCQLGCYFWNFNIALRFYCAFLTWRIEKTKLWSVQIELARSLKNETNQTSLKTKDSLK